MDNKTFFYVLIQDGNGGQKILTKISSFNLNCDYFATKMFIPHFLEFFL
jgi:hypothetical protein